MLQSSAAQFPAGRGGQTVGLHCLTGVSLKRVLQRKRPEMKGMGRLYQRFWENQSRIWSASFRPSLEAPERNSHRGSEGPKECLAAIGGWGQMKHSYQWLLSLKLVYPPVQAWSCLEQPPQILPSFLPFPPSLVLHSFLHNGLFKKVL